MIIIQVPGLVFLSFFLSFQLPNKLFYGNIFLEQSSLFYLLTALNMLYFLEFFLTNEIKEADYYASGQINPKEK